MDRKFIIDTDPGVDDAYAIFTASQIENYNILGISTVAGNIPIDRCNDNAMGIINFLKKDTKIFPGAIEPITCKDTLRNSDASYIHGNKGLGGISLPKGDITLQNKSAKDFIIESIEKYPNEIEIIAIGPLTNIATAILESPNTMKKVKAIWTMGGSSDGKGNTTEFAEFNYWADAKAVKIVFDFGKFIPIHMYGLNVTSKSSFTPEDILFIAAHGGELGKLMLDISINYIKVYNGILGNLNFIIHDLLTTICSYNNSICEYTHCHVDVITEGKQIGQTICDLKNESNNKSNVYVATTVDSVKFKELFVQLNFPTLLENYKKTIKFIKNS